MTEDEIHEITINDILDKSIIVYGGSNTGKTTMINHLIYTIRKEIRFMVVFSGSIGATETYKSWTPDIFIHDGVTEQELVNIRNAQKESSKIYNLLIDPDYTMNICKKIPSLKLVSEHLLNIYHSHKDLEKEIKMKIFLFFKKICKNILSGSYDLEITAETFEEYEYNIIQAHEFNPRVLIIFDDCTNQLSEIKSATVIKDIFFQGRWDYLTIIIALHSPTAVSPSIRMNSQVRIYTDEKVFQYQKLDRTNSANKILCHHPYTKVLFGEGTEYWVRAKIHIPELIGTIKKNGNKKNEQDQIARNFSNRLKELNNSRI
jgi:GTPase SAR1 family protein